MHACVTYVCALRYVARSLRLKYSSSQCVMLSLITFGVCCSIVAMVYWQASLAVSSVKQSAKQQPLRTLNQPWKPCKQRQQQQQQQHTTTAPAAAPPPPLPTAAAAHSSSSASPSACVHYAVCSRRCQST